MANPPEYKFVQVLKSKYASDMIVFVKFLKAGVFVCDDTNRAAILYSDSRPSLEVDLSKSSHPLALQEIGSTLLIQNEKGDVCKVDLTRAGSRVYAEPVTTPPWVVPSEEVSCRYDFKPRHSQDILTELDVRSVPEDRAGFFDGVLTHVYTFNRDEIGKRVGKVWTVVRRAYCYHAQGDNLVIGHDGNITLWTKAPPGS